MKRASWRSLLTALAVSTALGSATAAEQGDRPRSDSPAPPPGNGTLRGTVVHPAGAGRIAGLYVELYALLPNGGGRVAGATTDAQGTFEFGNLSTDPKVVYLVGTHYRQVAFGQRGSFAPGRRELDLVLQVSDPSGPEVESAELESDREIAIDGNSDHGLSATELSPGSQQVESGIELPEARHDPDALALGTAHFRVELDDTVLQVIQEQRMLVAGEAPVMGKRGAPLMHLELPPGAELAPLPATTADLGIEAGQTGGIDLLGPLAPGEYDVSWSYRVPTRDGSARLDLRFPKPLPLLEMRVADTGVIIESPHLNPLRPRTLGTRTYLMRRTWQVEAGETLSIRFRALEDRPRFRRVSLALVLVLAAAASFFVTAPLRQRPGGAAPRALEKGTSNSLHGDPIP